MNIIYCADCGAERKARNKNTRYCRVCRLGRNIAFLGQRTNTCWMCEERFAPLSANDPMCANCDYKSASATVAECALCHEQAPRVDHEIAVCIACAKDPKKRPLFARALHKKVKARIEGDA